MDRENPRKRADYKVGHKKPPREHQFKKGRSGNPRGRLKNTSSSLDIFRRIISQRVRVPADGVTHVMTLGEAVIFVNLRKAIKGDQSAQNNIDGIMNEAQMLLDHSDPAQVGGVIAVPERPETIEEFYELYGGPDPFYKLRRELDKKQTLLREKQMRANLPLSHFRF